LLLEYRPGSCATPNQLVEVLRTHLGRLERHVRRILGESTPKLKNIFLSGDRESVAAALREFAKVPYFQCQVISPSEIQATWQLTQALDDPVTLPVLGTTLGTYLPPGESDAPNFMDHITAISREPLKPILLRSLAPLAAVLVVALGLELFNLHQQASINDLQAQVDELAVDQARARELHLRQTASHSKLVQLNKLAEQLTPSPSADILRRIAHCMPSDVWLTSLTFDEDGSLALRGSSFLETGIFDFVRWLELAPGFEQVALRGTKSGQSQAGPTVDFDVQLKLGDDKAPAQEIARHE
jgi:Tfp pilus assembly protein PilN